MSDDAPKTTTRAKAKTTESVADAPGPISPEHESGSFAQTAKVDAAREALREAERADK